jgi:hypothetical protein
MEGFVSCAVGRVERRCKVRKKRGSLDDVERVNGETANADMLFGNRMVTQVYTMSHCFDSV